MRVEQPLLLVLEREGGELRARAALEAGLAVGERATLEHVRAEGLREAEGRNAEVALFFWGWFECVGGLGPVGGLVLWVDLSGDGAIKQANKQTPQAVFMCIHVMICTDIYMNEQAQFFNKKEKKTRLEVLDDGAREGELLGALAHVLLRQLVLHPVRASSR